MTRLLKLTAALLAILAAGALLLAAIATSLETQPFTPPAPAHVTFFNPLDQTWLTRETELPPRLVLLVHGLDEPGGIWDQIAPALAPYLPVARFDYPNDQPIADSATLLQQTLTALHRAGVNHVDLVCHSMGGLVARDTLTRPDTSDIAARLITVGTPNTGSNLAALRVVAELRDHAAHLFADDAHALAFAADGQGQAGDDLLPSSPYLADLNARPLPRAPITVIIGRLASTPWAAASDQLGDGVVTVTSAILDGADDTVFLDASHRGMLRTITLEEGLRRLAGLPTHDVPPAIPVILDRLGLGEQNPPLSP